MKNLKNFKNTLLKTTLITATLFVVSSCDNNKPEDTKEVAEEHNDDKFDNNNNMSNNNNNTENGRDDNNNNMNTASNNNIKEKDAQFLVDAAEINLEEIQLGQLAQQNSVTADVKQLAKMMVVEHTKSMKDLTALAGKKMITIPTSATDDAKDNYEKLSKKTGNDFDKKYTEMMVDGHKEAIKTFEKAAEESNDSEIKAWATATLPTLRTHLDHSLTVQKKRDKNVIISMEH